MSDSDDGFDEDAVREELREKYEEEREGREATARMSELLLQGATMTNDHCDRCGSPLFRQEGQTFCPNCQHAAKEAQAEGTQQSQGGQSPEQMVQGQQPQSQGQEAQDSKTSPGGAEATSDEASADGQQSPPAAGRTAGRRTPPSQQDGEATQPQQRDRAPTTDAPARHDPSTRDLPEHAPTATATGPAGDALESTIAALARRAASADDPRTAREYLEAAREAAEALATLR